MRTLNKTGTKKLLSLIITIGLILQLCCVLPSQDVYAQEAQETDAPALIITGDGVENEKSYTLEELKSMNQTRATFSTINTFPTKKWYVGEGIELNGLLEEAKVKDDAKKIIFEASDGFYQEFTVEEILEETRYRFPDFMEGDGGDGRIPGSDKGQVEVPTLLALISAEDDYERMNDSDGIRLMMGQRAVTEQNNPWFIKRLNKIEVWTEEVGQWDAPIVDSNSPEPGETVSPGTKITLSCPRYSDLENAKLYYTTDGSEPDLNSNIFNIIAPRWENDRRFNQPIEINETTTIKAVVIGPGKHSSDVAEFMYIVEEDESGGPEQPYLELTLPEEEYQFFELEDVVKIRGVAENISELNLRITDPDRKEVFSTELDIVDKKFEFDYEIPNDAKSGKHKIVLIAPELEDKFEFRFLVNIDKSENIYLTFDDSDKDFEFDKEKLQSMEQVRNVYSSINDWPTNKWYIAEGVRLQDILDEANVNLEEMETITFKTQDNWSTTFTKQELFEDERFCFPGLNEGSNEGKHRVDTIISLKSVAGEGYEIDPERMNDSDGFRIFMGQRALTEQTNAWQLKYINRIIISSKKPEKWDAVQANPQPGTVESGTEVFLDHPNFNQIRIYYTLDGSEPDVNSKMFNVSRTYYQPHLNKPIEINQDTTIKAIVIAPGKYDSEVVEFTYNLAEDEESPLYELIVKESDDYIKEETESATMLILQNVTGFKDFGVTAKAMAGRPDQLEVVFVHLRNGVQQSLNSIRVNSDTDGIDIRAGFNIEPDDVIKIYMVDELTNETDRNPIIFK